jgi:hypothetical protein
VNQLKIVVMKLYVSFLVISLTIVVNVAVVVVVTMILTIMTKVKNFFVIVTKHKENHIGVIIL